VRAAGSTSWPHPHEALDAAGVPQRRLDAHLGAERVGDERDAVVARGARARDRGVGDAGERGACGPRVAEPGARQVGDEDRPARRAPPALAGAAFRSTAAAAAHRVSPRRTAKPAPGHSRDRPTSRWCGRAALRQRTTALTA